MYNLTMMLISCISSSTLIVIKSEPTELSLNYSLCTVAIIIIIMLNKVKFNKNNTFSAYILNPEKCFSVNYSFNFDIKHRDKINMLRNLKRKPKHIPHFYRNAQRETT